MRDLPARIYDLEGRIFELEEELAELKLRLRGEVVEDRELLGWDGVLVKLSELFGEKKQLILIHNMGFDCSYCTMWADGFNALLPYIEDRAAFVLTSPDDIGRQKIGAAERGWRFRMVSTAGSNFAERLGFTRNGRPLPGVSTFVKELDGRIKRYSMASFGPGDRFCPVWSFFDMLPKR